MIEVIGTRAARKATVSRTNASPTTTITEHRQCRGQFVGSVDVGSGRAADENRRAGVAFDGGAVGADAVDQIGGGRGRWVRSPG